MDNVKIVTDKQFLALVHKIGSKAIYVNFDFPKLGPEAHLKALRLTNLLGDEKFYIRLRKVKELLFQKGNK